MRSLLTVGELCAGYGGIGLALEDLANAQPIWVSEVDKAANLVLRERFPWADHIGDMTTLDWHDVQPVDVLTGGTPCQDLSTAGRRRGMNPGTRSNLWVSMREAIAILRPGVVIWENVGGALSADAASELEQREGLLGVATVGPVLRALGRVVGDLASLGYVGGWLCVRASDIGAPHQRLRVFLIARERTGRGRRVWRSLSEQSDQWRSSRTGTSVERLLPTPTATDGSGNGQHPDIRRAGGHQVDLRDWVHGLLPTPRGHDMQGVGGIHGIGGPDLPTTVLLPTPAVNDIGGNKTIEWWDEWHVRQKRSTGEIAGHGKSLNIELQRLLPTPAATDGKGARATTRDNADPRYGDTLTDALWYLEDEEETSRLLPTVVASDQHNTRQSTEPKAMFANDTLTDVAFKDEWKAYGPAIRRWEAITRPAPTPTELSNGKPRLNARFSEWMMGLPSGWVTDLVPSSAGRRLCGNGVCPQQAAHAIAQLLARLPEEVT